jgi:hypothetical protein
MFFVDDNGDITLVQGDNGELNVWDLPTDRNYTLYFAIYDENRVRFGSEVSVATNGSSNATLVIPPALTDLLRVQSGEEYSTYYYGLKICYEPDGIEDTLLLGDSNLGDLNAITVYPKKVEGTV